MRIGRNGFGVAVVLAFSTGWVNAAPSPQAVAVGGAQLIPTLVLTQKFDDNIFSQDDKTIKAKDSGITQFQPTLQYLAEKDDNHIALTYTGDYGIYNSSSDDNYDDHNILFDALMRPSDLYSVNFGASYGAFHDNRGEGSSEGINVSSRGKPDEYNLENERLLIDVGRETARLGLEIEALRTIINYTNNRTDTRFRDRREHQIIGRLYGRVSDRTRYFVEASNEVFGYETAPLVGSSIDSNQVVVAVGASWEATGKTTGSIKVGRLDKKFDAADRANNDLTIWDADITWSPMSYSTVRISASKDAQETNGTGSFIEAQNFNVSWQHGWSDRMRMTLTAGIGDDEYPGNPRKDDRTSYSIGFDYDWQRWITIGASYSYTERDSNVDTFDFERNVFAFKLDMSL